MTNHTAEEEDLSAWAAQTCVARTRGCTGHDRQSTASLACILFLSLTAYLLHFPFAFLCCPLSSVRCRHLRLWRLFPDIELAKVAIALLSVAASEASVERSFSLQGAVHSKQRNRLHDSTVESEMFVRFNTPADPAESAECAEMDDGFDPEAHAEAMTLWTEAEAMVDQPVLMEIEPEAAAPAAAAAAAAPAAAVVISLRRTDSAVISGNCKFVDEWIREENVTPEFHWDKHVRMRLENASWLRNRGGWTTKELEKQIKAEVARRALEKMQA